MKRGFTIVELLVVLVILGLLSLVVYPSIIKIVNYARNDSKKNQEKIYLKAASEWVVEHPNDLPDFVSSGSSCECSPKPIFVSDLINEGYLTAEEGSNNSGYVEISCSCHDSCNTCKYEYNYHSE